MFEPRFLPELNQSITTVATSITRDIIHKVWEELDNRLDNHRISYTECFKSARCVQNREGFSVNCCRRNVRKRPYFLYNFETLSFFCGPSVLYLHASIDSCIVRYTWFSHSGDIKTAVSLEVSLGRFLKRSCKCVVLPGAIGVFCVLLDVSSRELQFGRCDV
jgi:hypothetical protein